MHSKKARKAAFATLFFILTPLLAILAHGCRTPPPVAGVASTERESVVFIHGVKRTGASMGRAKKRFANAGYNTLVCNYDSSQPVRQIATNLFARLEPFVADAPKVHFVTHSMGGIVLREHLRTGLPANLGRVVMLAPPNKGSELVDIFAELPGYGSLYGEASKELGTGDTAIARALPPIDFPCGVIAGDRSVSWLSWCVPGRDDGKVSITNTFADGISDHIVMHATHTFMTFNRGVLNQAQHFIETGEFERGAK